MRYPHVYIASCFVLDRLYFRVHIKNLLDEYNLLSYRSNIVMVELSRRLSYIGYVGRETKQIIHTYFRLESLVRKKM